MKLDNRLTMVVAIVISIAAVAAGWFLGVSPQLTLAAASATNASQISDQNTTMAGQIQTLQAAKAKLGAMNTTLSGLQTSIPETVQATKFLDDVNSVAASTGVSITNITIGTLTPYIKPAGLGPYSDGLVTAGNFGTSSVAITVTGSAAQGLAFVHGLQYGDRIMLVSSVMTGAATTGNLQTTTASGAIYVENPLIAKLATANG